MEEAALEQGLSDEHSLEQFSHLLTKEEIKSFSQLNNIKFLSALSLEIATIALAIWVSETFWNPFVYLLVVIVIGSRLHALGILMHDATHYRAHSNRKWNDFIGETIALLLPLTVQGYRNDHFPHHYDINTDKDPDWERFIIGKWPEYNYPKTKPALLWLLFQYALGLRTHKDLRAMQEERFNRYSSRLKLIRLGFYGILIVSSIAFGFWKQLILYWMIPALTLFDFFLYIRTVSEHYTNLEYQHVLNHSRTTVAPFWERWLFAPHNVNYHIEHHLYPSVPFYHLKKLHDYLMTKPAFAQSAHITQGYTTGLFRESCKAS